MVKILMTLPAIILFLLFFTSLLGAQVENLKKHEQHWEQISAAVIKAYRNGNYQKGIQLAEKAYQYAKEHLGKEQPSTLTSLNNLVGLYEYQGRYAEAEPLYKEALQLSEKVLGQLSDAYLSALTGPDTVTPSKFRHLRKKPSPIPALVKTICS